MSDSPKRIILSTGNGPTLFKPSSVVIPPTTNEEGSSTTALACKIVSVRPENDKSNLPTVPATVVVIDDITGMVSCIMAGTALTAIRTAAGSGVATKAMMVGKPAAKKLTVFGAGMQGEMHILSMVEVQGCISDITIVNRSSGRAEKLIEKLKPLLLNVTSFSVVLLKDKSTIEKVVNESDIICLCTNSSTPLFPGTCLSSNTHINGVGSYTPAMQEVDIDTIGRCSLVVDSNDALSVGDISKYVESPNNENLPINDILVGDLTGILGEGEGFEEREGGSEGITFFKSVGLAVQDTTSANMVLERAKELRVGTDFEF